jgi:hypothetical protein
MLMTSVAARDWIDDAEPLGYGPDKWLSERFDIGRFLKDAPAFRKRYFTILDKACDLLGDDGPSVAERLTAVRQIIAIKLPSEADFNQHVYRPEATELSEEDGWKKVYRAGAATIVEAYRNARKRGDWP